jgi:hypothetical protein
MAQPSFQQMWARPFKVVTSKQIPDSGGYSVFGNVYYIDSDLAAAIQSGKLVIQGMTAQQVMIALLTHERIEKCLLDADNDISTYPPAHEFATTGEHEYVRSIGAAPYRYEKGLAPMIAYNEKKPLRDVPRDLQCAPLLDDPDANDHRALRDLRRMGIPDSFKVAKKSVHYSRSKRDDTACIRCTHWLGGPQQDLSLCGVVSGLIRNSFWCKRFEPKGQEDGQAQQVAPGLQGGGEGNRPPGGNPQPGSSPSGGDAPSLTGGQEGEPPPQPGEVTST